MVVVERVTDWVGMGDVILHDFSVFISFRLCS